MYNFFREKTAKIAAGLADKGGATPRTNGNRSKGANILTLINFLRLICNSGEELLPQSALDAWRSKNSTSVNWQMMLNGNKICDSCGSIPEEVDSLSEDSLEFHCRHSICMSCFMQSDKAPLDGAQKCPICTATRVIQENSSRFLTPSGQLSAKVKSLIQNLNADKSLEQHEEKSPPAKRYYRMNLTFAFYHVKNFK